MRTYVRTVCSYVYETQKSDLDSGIVLGTASEDLPGDWVCLICVSLKNDFEPA
jgi:rubredoxin